MAAIASVLVQVVLRLQLLRLEALVEMVAAPVPALSIFLVDRSQRGCTLLALPFVALAVAAEVVVLH